MRRTTLLTLAALVAVAVGTQPSMAGPTESVRYVAGTGGSPQQNAPNPLGMVGAYGAGGYDFRPIAGKRPVFVEINDDVMGRAGIGVLVCSPTCDAFQKGFCSPANGKIDLRPFQIPDGSRISVAVAVLETGAVWSNTNPCENNAFTGTLSVTYN